MANQRVLDHNEDDESTKDGASDQSGHPSSNPSSNPASQGSHHDDMLGHILEDISLDEWDVIPDVSTPDASIPDASIPDTAIPDDSIPNDSIPDDSIPDDSIPDTSIPDASIPDDLAPPDISPPEDEWAASEIIPMPASLGPTPVVPKVEAESSLFAFSLMEKFGSDPEPAIDPTTIGTPIPETSVTASKPSTSEPDIPAPGQNPAVPAIPDPAIDPSVPDIPLPEQDLPISLPDIPVPVQDPPATLAEVPEVPEVHTPDSPASLRATPLSDLPAAGPVLPIDVPNPPVAIGPNPFSIPRTIVALDQATPPESPPLTPAPTPTPTLALAPNPASSPESPPPVAPNPALGPTTTPPLAPNPASSPVSTPAPNGGSSTAPSPTPHKRKPAATLIFDSFTKSKIGLDLLDPFNPSAKPQTISPGSAPTAGGASVPSATRPADQAAPKQRPTARTLIFKTGMSAEGMDPSYQPLAPSGPNSAANAGSSPSAALNPATTTGSNPTAGFNSTTTGSNPVAGFNSTATGSNPVAGFNSTATGSNPIANPYAATSTGSNPIAVPNPAATPVSNSSVGPNLAAAIAAANPFGVQAPVSKPVSAEDPNAPPRPNSNVIPAYNPVSAGRPIARTMILKSLPKPEQNELTEPNSTTGNGHPNILVSPETIIAAGEAAEADAASGKPKFAKRSTAPTLIFKAFTLPSADETAKPAPLKIIRYDSSKLRNLETNVKPIGIVESITAGKQASLAADDKNDRRPQWLKIIAANPLLKSPGFRSAALLIVLATVLLICSTALMRSLSDDKDFHPTNVSASARDQRHFKSTDGSKSFDLSDKGTVLIHNGKAIHGKIKNVSDGELFSLVTTPAAKREIWLQKTDAGYVDQDGTTLYSASAPELLIAKKVESYANLVAAKYKETKLYPSDVERLERISPKDFHYTNPFTGRVDQPSVQYKRFAAAEPSWTDHTQQAHNWTDEPQWKPGAIHCICLDYCRFFIRGFDRNGHPLIGSTPGIADYVELKDGVNMNPRRVDKLSDDKDHTPAVFMVSRNPGLQMEVGILRLVGPLAPVLLILVALGCGGWMLFLRKMKNNKADSRANTTKFTTK